MTKYTINELANSKGVSPLVREALLQMADYKQLYEQVCEQSDVLAKEFDAIKQALAAPVQPVAWMFEDDEDNGHKTFIQTPPSPEVVAYLAKWNRPAWVPIYTTPPAAQRPWTGLTDADIEIIAPDVYGSFHYDDYKFARAIEAKIFEKNGAMAVVIPDALNTKDENPAYAAGWNDCRAEMLKEKK